MIRTVLSVALLIGLCACVHRRLDVAAMDHPEKDGVPGVVETPLQDANMLQTTIPPVLLKAAVAPYAPPASRRCRALGKEIATLDAVLGDDMDMPQPARVPGQKTGETAVSLIRSAAVSYIPFRGWVRRLSGAQQQDMKVRGAVYAGQVRRAYLKGIGESRHCRFPASPYRAS